MKKTILFFGKLPPPYIGPSFATKVIIESSLKKRFNLIHFNLSHHKSINELGELSLNNLLYAFAQYYRFIKNIIKFKPDIVYIPSQQTTIAYLRDIPFFLITKLFRSKLVCHLRGGYFLNWYDESSFIVKIIIRYAQKLIDGQIVLGFNLKHVFEPFMDNSKIYVIPNGGNFNYDGLKVFNKKKIKILYLGNFIKSKGILDFLSSGDYLPKKYKDKIVFQIVGAHVDCENDIKDILRSRLDLKFDNLGTLSGKEKRIVLANADIFVFPTYYRNEGHPWVIVEALAAGLPIISTDRGAIIESVIDGYNGYIVKPKSPQHITEKIIKLIDDENLLNQMSTNSLNIYNEKFTEQRLVDNFSIVFNKILNIIK
jgi:glycosyltransferase involved in cell wall biosynthesis